MGGVGQKIGVSGVGRNLAWVAWASGVLLKCFVKFTGKHLCWSLLINKVHAEDLQVYLKRRLQHRCFLVNFAKFLRIPN